MMVFSPVPSIGYITLTTNEVGVEISFRQYFTLTDPYFDTDLSVNGLSEYACIIDIHTECMQGHTALFEFFTAGDFRTCQTTAQFDFDSFSTHTKCRSN